MDETKCELTQLWHRSDFFTKTSDGKDVYYSEYAECCDFWKKGILTYDECRVAKNYLKEYKEEQEYYMTYMRKCMRLSEEKLRLFLDELKHMEDKLALKIFVKTRELLTIDEQMTIQRSLMTMYALELKVDPAEIDAIRLTQKEAAIFPEWKRLYSKAS